MTCKFIGASSWFVVLLWLDITEFEDDIYQKLSSQMVSLNIPFYKITDRHDP